MKNAAEYSRRIRRLLNKLRREVPGASLSPVEDPMDQLMRGVLTDFASESRAASALSRLREAVVDLNELRVTPVSEIVEILGADFPSCRQAAESLIQSLNAIYNKTHHLDLTFLKKGARKTAEQFLHGLVGFNAHAKATIIIRCFKGHAVPIDATMLSFLRKAGCIPPDLVVDEAQKFLAGILKDGDAVAFYVRLKRYAASHAPRKGGEKVTSPSPPAATHSTETPAEEAAARRDANRKSPGTRSATAKASGNLPPRTTGKSRR